MGCFLMAAPRPVIVAARCLLLIVAIFQQSHYYCGEARQLAFLTRPYAPEFTRFHPNCFEIRRRPAYWPFLTISRGSFDCQGAIKVSVSEHADIKTILRLNRRKFPKLIRNCRADAKAALSILENAYPHMAFSSEERDCVESTLEGPKFCYRQLLDILHKGEHMDVVAVNGCNRNDAGKRTSDDTLVVDAESIIATMEVFGKARNVPAAMILLRLSVEGVRHNQQCRDQTLPSGVQTGLLRLQDDNDRNELRRIYKATFSLLGHTYEKQKGSAFCTQLIVHLLRHHMPQIARVLPGAEIYHAAINALGKVGDYDLILEILEEIEQYYESILRKGAAVLTATKNADSPMNTNIAPPSDTMSYQTAIASLSRHNHCNKAMQLLYRMRSKGLSPDTNTYNHLLIGIAKEAGRDNNIANANYHESFASVVSGSGNVIAMPWHNVALQILHEMETLQKHPTEQSYNSVMSACGKEGNWNAAARVAEKAETLSSHSAVINTEPSNYARIDENETASSAYFDNLRSFCKVGKGSDSWWEIGRYSLPCANDENAASHEKSRGRERGIIIGIQPHRNPLCNGLSIVFHDEASRVKLGRMLLRNVSSRRPENHENHREPLYYSSLVGMEVTKTRRGEGLSKIFVAIWLHICLKTNTYPRAAVMNKPLISFVLKGFNFVPQNGGSRVGLIRLKNDNNIGKEGDDYKPQFGLYSPSAKSLQGLFSRRYLRVQNIAILDHPPSPNSGQDGTFVYVKTGFEHPIAISENAVEYTPPHLLANDDTLLSKESTIQLDHCHQSEQQQQKETLQGSIQRNILASQIDSILKTNVENTTASGNLEYFANITSLKGSFLSYDRLVFSHSKVVLPG